MGLDALSSEQHHTWGQFQAAFDPWRSSRPEDIQHLYVERPGGPERLLRLFGLLDEESYRCVVFCGARGSGKSTELARLGVSLRSRFAVMSFDLEAALPSNIGTLGLIALIGALVDAAIEAWRQPTVDGLVLASSQPSAFHSVLEKLGIGATRIAEFTRAVAPLIKAMEGEQGLPEGSAETVQMTTRVLHGLTHMVGQLFTGADARKLEPGAYARDRTSGNALIEGINERLGRLKELTGKPAIFLLDGLDRTTELDDVRGLFRDIELLRRLKTNIVLSGPIAVRHTAQFRAVGQELRTVMLENIPIRDAVSPHGPHEAGLALLEEIYRRRCAQWKLQEDVVAPEALRAAALMSAGLVRDFLLLLQEAGEAAASEGESKISASCMDEVIAFRRQDLQGYLNEELIAVLLRVLETELLPREDVADRLLFENFIACYRNGDLWFRPHELLVGWLERRASDRGARDDTTAGER